MANMLASSSHIISTLVNPVGQMKQSISSENSEVEMLLVKLKLLQQARLQAEAEALAAAAAVDMSIPQSMHPKLSSTLQLEAYSAARKRRVVLRNAEEEVSSQENPRFGSMPDLVNDIDVDHEWCDNVLSGSDENGPSSSPGNIKKISIKRKSSGLLQNENGLSASKVNLFTPLKERLQFENDSSPIRTQQLSFNMASLENIPEFGYYSDENALRFGMNDQSAGNEDCGSARKPRQKRGSATDPQSLAARARREKIASKIRRLQDLVPGTDKLDTASMLEHAIDYVKNLKAVVAKSEDLESVESDQGAASIGSDE